MAVGNYGITRPADVDINDIEVYYSKVLSRDESSSTMTKIDDSSEVLDYCYIDDNDEEGELLEGMYNLKLPSTIFDDIGIYTIYLKPKTIKATVVECGVLSTLPNVIGLILYPADLDEKLRTNNALQGYRIEYLDDGEKIRNRVRYVVSSNRVVKEQANTTNQYQIATNSYVFDDTNDNAFIFLQVTPSSAYDIKPNVRPEIGDSGTEILLSNTYFSPVMIEVEIVENTIDTLGDLIAGEQLKDVQRGIVTHFDKNDEITRQFDVYKIKDDVDDRPLYEVKERRTAIDGTQTIENATSQIE